MLKLVLHLLLGFLTIASFSQGQSLVVVEEEMGDLHRRVLSLPAQAERFEANLFLMEKLDEALRLDPQCKHPFDSLKSISVLMSSDRQFRIFTWYVPHQDGVFTYYGVIQSWNPRQKQYQTHWLEDRSDEIDRMEEALLSAENWFGALYYEIIPLRSRGRTYYTLLGWDGNNPRVNRKIIEVLHFRGGDSPAFGHYLFRGMPGKNRRILFEYSGRASMTLRYDTQSYWLKQRKRNRRIVEKEIVRPMIVFDRLAPMNPSLEGNPAFLVPEGHIQDAFVAEDGRWKLIRDIDARNQPRERNVPAPVPPQRGLFPPK